MTEAMTGQRISRDLALEQLRHHLQANPRQTRTVHVTEALGLVCARNLFAAHSSPVMPKSTMDGYALDSQATLGATPETPVSLVITGEIRPSTSDATPLLPGQAVAILTGGQLPPGSDCAVPAEAVEVKNGSLVLTSVVLSGQHVCQAGSDIKAGSRIIRRGEDFTPAVLAALAVSGIMRVVAYLGPKTRVLAIGNELAPLEDESGTRLPADNLLMATGLLRLRGVDQVHGEVCANSLEHIADRLRELSDCDCIVTTGGTGPGQRDFILRAASLAGFTPLFNGVALTPGKSFFAAVRERTILFALPGTPWAVFALLHALVLPAVCWLRGRTLPVPSPVLARPLVTPAPAQPGWEKLVPCTIAPHGSELHATPLLDRGREMRRDMIEAQGLLIVSGLEEPGELLPMIPIWEHRRGHRFD
ncbi:MAG: molybdopterin molybdotransferase MoeA [Proteobacteria bacterium]|nr:molybdopterin molybdotransferase MoeA [Pseudomonadota bacterium]